MQLSVKYCSWKSLLHQLRFIGNTATTTTTTKKKKMFQIVSSPSFKHLRFDFFNMRISTRFGIQLRKITIKSWIEATSLQPSIPMVGVEKMLRLPSLKLTKFAKNGWDQNTIPGCNPYFGGMFFFVFAYFPGVKNPPSSAHRPCSCGCVP